MVARDVVVVLIDSHADPFQSGFDSQHRQETSWIENKDGLIPSSLLIKFFLPNFPVFFEVGSCIT
jgi:hypothetical protein